MKTFNLRYRNIEKLRVFIDELDIKDSSSLLIQIISPIDKEEKLSELLKELNSLFPSSKIIGFSSSAGIYDSKIVYQNIIISFTVFESSRLKLEYTKHTIDSNPFNDAKKLAKSVIQDDTKALLLFCTFKDINAQRVLKGVESLSSDIVVSGLVACDDLKFEKSFIICHEKIIESGYLALSISGKQLKAYNQFSSDWQPLSKEFIVTKSDSNKIIELDNQNASKIYRHYLGDDEKPLPSLALEFPLLCKRKGRDFTLQITDIRDDALILNSNIKKGERVWISFSNLLEANKNAKLLGDVISNGDFESLFIYSSLARERFINQIHLKELESITLLQNSFGGYGYGEFFQSGENSYLLNHSITFLALLESSQNKSSRTIKRRKRYARSKEDTKDLKTIEILSNIAKVSSHELELLNKKLNYKIESGVREMRKKESILIHNSRLAQLGEMLGLIAHQWRQPLSAISATATGMQVKLELDSANKEYLLESLDHIEKYVLHLSETIDDFTNFFKPVKKRENVEIKELIKKALFISSSLLSKNSIELIEKYCSDDKIYTYPNEIVQVILNIIKNSSNALEKNKIPNPEIYINEYKKGDKVVIEISDNAGGIDKKIIDKIFEPYFSTKDSKESMGLGLYMSKFIIEESCQGKLEVENSQRGAKFRITLETIN